MFLLLRLEAMNCIRRSASGDLGDIISVSKAQLQDCINAGIILDITDYYENSTYLKAYDVAVEGYKDWLGTDRYMDTFKKFNPLCIRSADSRKSAVSRQFHEGGSL